LFHFHFLLTEKPRRFDCVLNQWNASEEFNFERNMHLNQELASDEMDEFEWIEEDPMAVDVPLPTFQEGSLLHQLETSQFSLDTGVAELWLDNHIFALKSWGLHLTGEEDPSCNKFFPRRLGLFTERPDTTLRRLFDGGLKGLTADFDLHPSHPGRDRLPQQLSGSVLHIQPVGKAYLLTVRDKDAYPWKLLIEDPLVLLQIEREQWHLQPEGLVSNLIQKGLRFKILYPCYQEGATFYRNPGPVTHPMGKAPTHADYLAYRLEVAHFFELYPHAHVAALCSGGILWRIAVDVLPIPAESDLVHPFHEGACETLIINGRRYWSPILCLEDEEMIVGVYKWPGKSS
jgi:hypothetical protein